MRRDFLPGLLGTENTDPLTYACEWVEGGSVFAVSPLARLSFAAKY